MPPLTPWLSVALGALSNRDAQQVPFSFSLDGRPSSLLDDWERTSTSAPTADGLTRERATFAHSSGLVVTCNTTHYADFPAIEWTLSFEHTGTQPSPLIEDIRALDLSLPVGDAQEVLLHAARGGICTPEDYEPLRFDLTQAPFHLHGGGGRSSNGQLPFFNLQVGGQGVLVAVGWSGQWRADLCMADASQVRLRAGIETTRLRLLPGESIRTARILLVAWQGDPRVGHNALRRLIYRHCLPLLDGEKPLPPVQCNSWFPVGDNGGKATEQNQVELLSAYASLGIEYLVMDAGWYGESDHWPSQVGTWRPREDAFPRGLAPIGRAAQEAGIGFGMWFEPERVRPETELDVQHPEWLIEIDGEENKLLNLGLPAVRRWVVELISRYVDQVPLRYFRHDFNMDPLPYWRAADAPDRAGMTEIRYVEGLYAIWDQLHARYPGLMIEGCSSGGRRIDLESISRCHTYWKSDLYGINHANQGHVYGASFYLPGNYLNTPLFSPGGEGYAAPHYVNHNTLEGKLAPADPYAFRSVLGGALCLGWDPRLPGFDRDLAVGWIERFKSLRHLMVGEFYPLTPYSLQPTDWMGYQFHRPDLGQGMAVMFRREESPFPSVEIALQGLLEDRTYELVFEDSGEKRVGAGEELLRPLRVTIDRAPGSALLVYREIGVDTPKPL